MILFTIVSILVLLYLLSYILPVPKQSGLHGSAQFSKNILKSSHDGLVIDGKGRITQQESFVHLACISPTGAGKTTAFILPNLLTLSDCSMICTDVKGELTHLTSGYLEKQGYRVLILDAMNIHQSLRYNPLAYVHTQSDIKEFATQIYTMASTKTEEGIWKHGAITIIELLLRALQQAGATYFTIANLLHLLHRVNDGTQEVDAFMAMYAPDEETKQMYRSFLNQDFKVMSGQLSSAMTALAPFATPEIKQLTAKNELDFQSLRTEKTVLYLKVPANSEKFAPVLTLLYGQLITYLISTPVENDHLPLYILGDEFGQLKKLPNFVQAITLLRSQRVSLSLVLQDRLQLDKIYGSSDAETILANCAHILAYPGIRGEKTLRYIQQLLGHTTKASYSSHGGTHHVSRPLMTLDEIRTMAKNMALFISGNRYGQKIYPTPIYANKKLMKQAGLSSENDQLRSAHLPVQHTYHDDPVVLFPLSESDLLDQDIPDVPREMPPEEISLQEQLNELLQSKPQSE